MSITWTKESLASFKAMSDNTIIEVSYPNGQNVQRKSTIGKPGPPIDSKRERMRHVQVEEEKEKGIYEYMCYRRKKLVRKQIGLIYRKWKREDPTRKMPEFEPIHKPPITPEVLKMKAERRKHKQQVYEIINQGLGDAMRKATDFCRYTRPEYMSYTVQLALVDKLVIHTQPSRCTMTFYNDPRQLE